MIIILFLVLDYQRTLEEADFTKFRLHGLGSLSVVPDYSSSHRNGLSFVGRMEDLSRGSLSLNPRLEHYGWTIFL